MVKDKMADFWWIFNIQCLIIIDNKKIRKIMINPNSMIHQYTFLKYYILYLAYAAIISQSISVKQTISSPQSKKFFTCGLLSKNSPLIG